MNNSQPLIQSSFPSLGVLQIKLNRPAQRNALNSALLREMAEELIRAQADPRVRCVLIVGDERAFSAGADIKEMQRDGFEALNSYDRQAAWDTAAHFPKPMLAAVRGLCLGGGFEFAMLADIIIAADDSIFGQPEITIGVIPGDGATQRLTRVAGKSLAMKMILSGEPITAQEALQAGLVAEVVLPEQVIERAIALATTIAQRAPIAARLAKEAILAAYESTLSAGLTIERRAIRHAFTTEDQKEGMAAFVEKRSPVFIGR